MRPPLTHNLAEALAFAFIAALLVASAVWAVR